MKQILKKQWEYILYEDSEQLLLSVVCGTIAMFDRNIFLSENEIQQYKEKGVIYINLLAEQIRNDPNKYKDRHVII